MFALVDCNNFYASCERVFNPKWNGKPLVVLSNNDGCVIARSQEAKILGIPMGAPYFQYKELMDAHDVIVCSSNFALYGDISDRVMEILKSFASDMQIYSIDEAFMHLKPPHLKEQAQTIRRTVLQCLGIPISIGIAPTKTLAKVANRIAKKSREGICLLLTQEETDRALDTLDVTEIWGIGSRMGRRLNRLGIMTAKELREAQDIQIKKRFSVTGLRTVMELRGVSCLPLEEAPSPKQSVRVSRTFSHPIDSLLSLHEAVSTFTAKAAEKIRVQHSLAASMAVFLELYPYDPSSCIHVRTVFSEPTAYTPHLVSYAKKGVQALFRKGSYYRRAGVILDSLVSDQNYQLDFLSPLSSYTEKQKRAMNVMDQLNKQYGRDVVHTLAEGLSKSWETKKTWRTPRYTTHWEEVLTIKI